MSRPCTASPAGRRIPDPCEGDVATITRPSRGSCVGGGDLGEWPPWDVQLVKGTQTNPTVTARIHTSLERSSASRASATLPTRVSMDGWEGGLSRFARPPRQLLRSPHRHRASADGVTSSVVGARRGQAGRGQEREVGCACRGLGGIRGGGLPGPASPPGRRSPTARCAGGVQDTAQGCSPPAGSEPRPRRAAAAGEPGEPSGALRELICVSRSRQLRSAPERGSDECRGFPAVPVCEVDSEGGDPAIAWSSAIRRV